ncbi:hypothetical protein [Cupriavidus pauculus]|uniref:hypothetical protein n=1 Tax=Cupriavidus pauculus TaxID=82633 RepID=UPI001EE3533C|nr:hypothetical protein [Cupriavidus pauculus]GJG96777.1 hypothetical protein CBA19C6_19830 [Cupriavidus pauculus]
MVYPIGPRIAYIGNDVVVQFDYFIAGHSQTFAVTRQALQDRFGLHTEGLSESQRDIALHEAFVGGWERIRSVAARKGGNPSDTPVVMSSNDFPHI